MKRVLCERCTSVQDSHLPALLVLYLVLHCSGRSTRSLYFVIVYTFPDAKSQIDVLCFEALFSNTGFIAITDAALIVE